MLAAGGIFYLLSTGVATSPDGLAEDGQPGALEPTPEPLAPVVVARVDIAAGTIITDATLLETREIPQSAFDEQAQQLFSNPSDVIGQLALRNIANGEQIRRDALTEPGLSQEIPESDDDDEARPKAYPLEVDNLTGVADQIRPNDFVDIFVTYVFEVILINPDTGNETIIDTVVSKTVAQRVQVLRILRPRVATTTEGEGAAPPPGDAPPEPGAPPATDEQGRPIAPEATQDEFLRTGSWILILALNNQEAELLELSSAVCPMIRAYGLGEAASRWCCVGRATKTSKILWVRLRIFSSRSLGYQFRLSTSKSKTYPRKISLLATYIEVLTQRIA
ncbi:MAG: Flp pilus assembly protein CpaB [Chloroflexaceae bacterium]|nr:Flp pilus assembly protein CpaB [Chloroflexaceae bacterium]